MSRALSESPASSLPGAPGSFVRALWGLDVALQSLPPQGASLAPRRPRFSDRRLWLPVAPLVGVAGSFSDYQLAAAAHASAHLEFGAQRFQVKTLKPVQVAIVSLIEDARVERLAALRFPGLARLWAPFFEARTGGAKTSGSLFARLARALHDDQYVDEDDWVNKGRTLFLDARGAWPDRALSRQLGSLLGNDLGQMRVQFNAKDYLVQPPYRDDNVGLWQFEHEPSQDSPELELEGARSSESESPEQQRRPQTKPEPARAPEPFPALRRTISGVPAQIAAAIVYPEWDYVIERERPEFCCIYERVPESGSVTRADERDASSRRNLERSAARLASRRPTPMRRLLDGDRLELPAVIAAVVARASGTPPDPRIYRRLRFEPEPPSLLLLLDLSESLNAAAHGASSTLLELARSASVLLASTLESVSRDFAVHGFSSNGRHEVGYFRFKDFGDPYDERAQSRLAGMRASLSTRLGTALRHAGHALSQRAARRRLLLVLSDGEPSDVDVHDANYLTLDAKHATLRNRQRGIRSFCLGLDPHAEPGVQRIFGAGNYLLLEQLDGLPQKLSQLYLRLSA